MNPAKPIIIINDPLIFTQSESDMHVSNFGVDKYDNTVLLDFGQIGRLPLSFAKYTMKSEDDFVARVANLLRWPDNSNIDYRWPRSPVSMDNVQSETWCGDLYFEMGVNLSSFIGLLLARSESVSSSRA
jgi:hypothetical protein